VRAADERKSRMFTPPETAIFCRPRRSVRTIRRLLHAVQKCPADIDSNSSRYGNTKSTPTVKSAENKRQARSVHTSVVQHRQARRARKQKAAKLPAATAPQRQRGTQKRRSTAARGDTIRVTASRTTGKSRHAASAGSCNLNNIRTRRVTPLACLPARRVLPYSFSTTPHTFFPARRQTPPNSKKQRRYRRYI